MCFNISYKKGCILQKEFLSLDFESSELNFDYIDTGILEYNVIFNILSVEVINNPQSVFMSKYKILINTIHVFKVLRQLKILAVHL